MGHEEPDGVSIRRTNIAAKGLQPRAVLGLLVGGSLAGIWITHVADPLGSRLVTWLLVLSLGLFVGGCYWRLALFDRTAFDSDEHYRYVQRRWERLEAIAIVGGVLSASAALLLRTNADPDGFGGLVLGLGLVTAGATWTANRVLADASHRREAGLRAGRFLAGLVALGGLAWLETGSTLTAWLVRYGHVVAFSLWLGGACWHNFVILPTMRSRLDAANTLTAQARRFRRHLPFVIAILVATGTFQTDRLVGLSASALLETRVGHLVGFKLFVVTVLTGLVIAKYKRSF